MKGSDWMYLGIGAGALYLIYKLTKPASDIGEDIAGVTDSLGSALSSTAGLLDIPNDARQLRNAFDQYNDWTEQNSEKLWRNWIIPFFEPKTYSQPPMPSIPETNRTIASAGGDTRVLRITTPAVLTPSKISPAVTREIPIPQPLKTPSTLFNIVNNPFNKLASSSAITSPNPVLARGPRAIKN